MAEPLEELIEEPEDEDAPPPAAEALRDDDEEPGCTVEGGLARL